MPISNICQNCGEGFKSKPSEGPRKFCGVECYRAYEAVNGRPSPVQAVEFKCKNCGDTFSRNPGELRSYVAKFGRPPLYCSIPCSAVGRRADTDADAASKTNCVVCGNEITQLRKPGGTINRLRRICSSECRKTFKLEEHERLRPLESREVSRTTARHGYIRLIFPRTETADGYEILEHRYVMEQALGRPLLRAETIHHRNGQKTDNRLENLDLRSGNHGPGGDVPAMIRWAHAFIALYPQFDREGNFTPVDGAGVDHSPNVSAT